jgi:hypothetical protein
MRCGADERQALKQQCRNITRAALANEHALILMGGWNAAQRIQPCENQVRQTIPTTGNTVGGGATSCRLAELAPLTKSG